MDARLQALRGAADANARAIAKEVRAGREDRAGGRSRARLAGMAGPRPYERRKKFRVAPQRIAKPCSTVSDLIFGDFSRRWTGEWCARGNHSLCSDN